MPQVHFKKITISQFTDDPEPCEIVYVVLENCCYFVQINQCEGFHHPTLIIQGIIEEEGFGIFDTVEFFEVQTFLSTEVLCPGEYDFIQEEISYDGEDAILVGWEEVECPDFILDIFRSHIGGTGIPKRVYSEKK